MAVHRLKALKDIMPRVDPETVSGLAQAGRLAQSGFSHKPLDACQIAAVATQMGMD